MSQNPLRLNLCSFPGIQRVVCADTAVKMGVKLVEHRVAVAKVVRRHRIGPLSHTMTGDIREWRVGIKAYHILTHFVSGLRVKSQRHHAAP